MFGTVLIANRGEIACRIIGTAQRMGLRSVAVYSEADRDARHVRLADEAWCIGGAAPLDSYLRADAILQAALESGAQAIHPGYGFLSESEAFARACAAAGIAFVGPAPEAIAAMGDKAAAKALMAGAGVPLVPGYHGKDQDAALLAREAERIGFPVLIKASAGGGGKGMRVVRLPGEFAAALEGARREAQSAFGDDRVLIERCLERPRHIEVQVFGDRHGNLVHLFERDCSVQRRHQKVIEEAPAPGMTAERRREMGAAAVAAARAIGYTGAGTVEFIVDAGGQFHFMEMNTRLQVEHPVTEMITGFDLVEWQLRVAAGEPLPARQEEISIRGHAIEARIYAEDPEQGFLPSSGRIAHLRFPCEPGRVRVDSGFESGAEITPHYDPLIAKMIAWGADRPAALAALESALAKTEIAGPANNLAFLRRVLATPAFAAGDFDTGLIERHRATLFRGKAPVADEVVAAAVWAELTAEEAAAGAHALAAGDPHSPWHRVDGWRLNLGAHHRFAFRSAESRHEARVEFLAEGRRLRIGGRDWRFGGESLEDGELLIRLDDRAFRARALRDGASWQVLANGENHRLTLEDELHGLDAEAGGGSLAAPMPGKVVQVLVTAGAQVEKGAALVILEAMKMEHTVTAPRAGTVIAILCRAGEQVGEGAELLKLEDAK
ncbi:MAG: 3-methylcrotonyl-CoA carboxylase [Betaproteobacteria bacterium RIFCSPLOWO2_02_FULL_67_19]|nr:MAG: 3-methylcrotonyl-CoA carboxylase [Betaproteobacteria bacterium RIFCSPLOWO2_02_FULL_67_19]